MNPFIELMQAGALIMLLFAVVLILVVFRNLDRPTTKLRARPYKLSLSVGRANYDPQNPVSFDDLIRQADILMYQEKTTKAQRPRVVVGDDDVSIRGDAERIFGEHFEVITAQNGEEVIRRATLERPD